MTKQQTRSLFQSNAAARFIAAQLARWVPESVSDAELQTLSGSEPIAYVRSAFMDTLNARERDRDSFQLLNDLIESKGPRQSCIVDVLFRSVAPECLGRLDDVLRIGPTFDRLPLTLQDNVQSRNRQALERAKQEHRS